MYYQALLGEVMGGMVQQTLIQMSECIGALGLRHNTQVVPNHSRIIAEV